MYIGQRFYSAEDSRPTIVWIYALRCPDTDSVMYIGQSESPMHRYRAHLNSGHGHRNGSRKQAWIYDLKQDGKCPVMEILDTCRKESALELEEKYISEREPSLNTSPKERGQINRDRLAARAGL